jgi:hypothetical protein
LAERSVLAKLVNVFPSPRVKKSLNILRQTQDTLIGLGKTLIGREKALLDGVAYMFWVEVSTNLLADIMIVMLSAKGQPLHIEPDDRYRFVRHATSIEDLDSPSVNLAMKLGFLETCELSCFEKYVDRKLRNKIAHMDFETDDKGNFFIYEKKNGEVRKKQVDIQQKLLMLNYLNSAVMRHIKVAVHKAKESQKTS